MAKKIDILKELNQILIDSLNNRETYKQGFQNYLLKFCKNYDTTLNKNSKPLFDFYKKLDSVEKVKINMWLKQNSSLQGVSVSEKGCKLTFKEGYESLIVFNDSLMWYDMKIEVKPFEPSEEKLKKSLANLLKHYEKESIKAILETL